MRVSATLIQNRNDMTQRRGQYWSRKISYLYGKSELDP